MNLLLAGHLHCRLLPDLEVVTKRCEFDVFECRSWPRVRGLPCHAASAACRPDRAAFHAVLCELPASTCCARGLI